jgi:putative RecB family exonuclease
VKLSPTQLSMWRTCPLQFWFEYVARPRPVGHGGPWAHYVLGNGAHNGLRDLWLLPAAQRTPEMAQRLVAAQWSTQGFRDEAQAEVYLAQTQRWVAQWVTQAQERGALQGEPPGVERTVGVVIDKELCERCAPLGQSQRGCRDCWVLTVEGRIDLIERRIDDDGRPHLVVVDYKLGKRAPTRDDLEESYALPIYALGTMRVLGSPAGGWCEVAELHHLPTGTVHPIEYDKTSMARHLGHVRAIAHEIDDAARLVEDSSAGRVVPADEAAAIRDAAYPAEPGPLCGHCPFLEMCEAGQQVATRAEPWGSLPGLSQLSAA